MLDVEFSIFVDELECPWCGFIFDNCHFREILRKCTGISRKAILQYRFVIYEINNQMPRENYSDRVVIVRFIG